MSQSIENNTQPSCIDCGLPLIVASFDYDWNGERPKRCPSCTKLAYEREEQRREVEADKAWQKQKERDQAEFLQLLKQYNVIPVEDVHIHEGQTLCVLGNGFDLMHGVRSSYYCFRDSLEKRNGLRDTLETYLTPKDIWSDFESALAKINVPAMNSYAVVDNLLDLFDAYESEKASDFCLAVDTAAEPMSEIARELDPQFRKWVQTLKIGTDDRPLRHLFTDVKVLNFNYTEFPETLYDVPREKICYIHGCRKHKNQRLILGHSYGASDAMFDYKDTSFRGISKGKRFIVERAQEMITESIAYSDEALTKHTDDIIHANQPFFNTLNNIRDIVVIGHSLANVDMDYFRKIVASVDDPQTVRWYVGCHGLRDLKNLESACTDLSISREQLTVFRTDVIRVTTYPSENKLAKKVKQPATEQSCGYSLDEKWRVTSACNMLRLYRGKENTTNNKFVFSQPIYRIVFLSNQRLMVVVRGVYSAIFLMGLDKNTEQWTLITELQSIKNQSLINPRLRHVFLTFNTLTFIYQNRLRRYLLSDGSLVANYSLYGKNRPQYSGKDIFDMIIVKKDNHH